jgi:hypothetical protein
MSVIVYLYDPYEPGYFWGQGGVAYYAGAAPSFLDLGGGTLDFAGVDTFTLPPVPLDGVNAVYRDQRIAPATLPDQLRRRALCAPSARGHDGLDHRIPQLRAGPVPADVEPVGDRGRSSAAPFRMATLGRRPLRLHHSA